MSYCPGCAEYQEFLSAEIKKHREVRAYAVALRDKANALIVAAKMLRVEAKGYIRQTDSWGQQVLKVTEWIEREEPEFNDQTGSAKAAGAPGAESTAAPTNERHETCTQSEWVKLHNRMPDLWVPVEIEFSNGEIRTSRWTGEVWEESEPWNRTGIVQWRYLAERATAGCGCSRYELCIDREDCIRQVLRHQSCTHSETPRTDAILEIASIEDRYLPLLDLARELEARTEFQVGRDAQDEANDLARALALIANLAMPRATSVQREIHAIAIKALTGAVEARASRTVANR